MATSVIKKKDYICILKRIACIALKNYFKNIILLNIHILHITICMSKSKDSSFRSHDWTRDKYFDIFRRRDCNGSGDSRV